MAELTFEWTVIETGTPRRHIAGEGGFTLCGGVHTGYGAHALGTTVSEQEVVDGRVRNLCGRCTAVVRKLAHG
jgi:hypothetical protein